MLGRTQVSALVLDITGQTLTRFQESLAAGAHSAAGWIVRAIDACGGQGASAYYSRLRHPVRGWAPAFPEVTGALIPTLLQYARFSGRQDLAALAVMQARWIVSLQSLDGSLPGGFSWPDEKGGPTVFSTAQMMLGLVAAGDHSGNQEFLQAAAGAARWLCDELSETAGTWLPQPQAGFSPAHHTSACWAMLEVWQRTREDRIRAKALKALDTMAGWQLANGAVRNWGLHPDRPACTDTIADTLRGFAECGRILGEDGKQFADIAGRMAEAIREQLQSAGPLAGAYDEDLVGDHSFRCLAGECRLARIWLGRAENTGDLNVFRAAVRTLWAALGRQRSRLCLDPNSRGALPGAVPRWHRYGPFQYLARTAGSFLDAVTESHHTIQRSMMEASESAEVI